MTSNITRLSNGGCFDEWAGERVRCPEEAPVVLEFEGRRVQCLRFLRRTPQGEYRYKLRFTDGETVERDVDEGVMLEMARAPFELLCPKTLAGLSTPYAESLPEPNALPEDDAARLEYPMFDGLLAYFPNALAEVARVSKLGNDQHNPGEPMHWARGKSTDHENKIMRHLVDVGRKDRRGVRHAARLAWRALALLQEELEREEGVPLSRGARR